MPLIDFGEEEEKKKLLLQQQQNNFENISIPKPPRSERHSSRSYYGPAASDSPKSYSFDPFEPEPPADTISYKSAVSAGGTSTDESKESCKSIDSWHNSSPPSTTNEPTANSSFQKTYYSVVPSENYSIPTPPAPEPNDTSVSSRLYDHVPEDPNDPFEVPTQIKDLTKSQRYSDMYSTVNKANSLRNGPADLLVGKTKSSWNGPDLTSPVSDTSPIRRPVIPDKVTVRAAVKVLPTTMINTNESPKKSSIDSSLSSPFSSPLRTTSQQSTASRTFPSSSSATSTPTRINFSVASPSSNDHRNTFAYGERTNIFVPSPSPAEFSTQTTRVQSDLNDFAYKQSMITSELNTRLNITNNSNSSAQIIPTMTVHPQPQFSSNASLWKTPTYSAGVGGYATAFSNPTTNATTFDNKQQWQCQNWIPVQQQQNGRTFSEPNVSRSGVLQPVSVSKCSS